VCRLGSLLLSLPQNRRALVAVTKLPPSAASNIIHVRMPIFVVVQEKWGCTCVGFGSVGGAHKIQIWHYESLNSALDLMPPTETQ
jgi:hypothetical protein